MKKSSYIFMIVFALLIFTRALSQSVKTQNAIIPPHKTFVVKFSGFAKGNTGWISIAAKGQPDNRYLNWGWIYGREAGTMEFSAIDLPLDPGDYEIRGYCVSGYEVCTRYSFRVANLKPKAKSIARKNVVPHKKQCSYI